MRVVCHDVHPVTAIAWHEETLCIGTAGGLVRAVDMESGSTVGDYYLASHHPATAISALRFDGAAIVAGDECGRVHVWRAALPGSWGFSHSPEWVLSELENREERQAHKAEITGLACTGSGRVIVSSDAEGVVVFWQPLGSEREVRPAQSARLRGRVRGLCADPEREDGVYVGRETELLWLHAEGDSRDLQSQELLSFPCAITALEWDAHSRALLIGLEDGSIRRWRPSSNDDPHRFDFFHQGAVRQISLTSPPASSDPSVPRMLHMVTSGSDGRVGVWDLEEGTPLWGLQGLSAERTLALGDHSRLVCTGCEVNADFHGLEPGERSFSQSWKDPLPTVKDAPTCDAVLCFDLLGEAAGAGDAQEQEPFWPSAAQKAVDLKA